MWRVLCCVGLLFTTVNAAGLGEACSESDPCTEVLGHGESECVRVYGSCEPTCQCDADSYESTEGNTCEPVHGCLLLLDCDNTLVGSAVCNEKSNTCECGGEIATIDYHGTDYCDRTRLDQSCEDDVSNCLAYLIDDESAVCDTEDAGLCACNVSYMRDPDPDNENVACIKYPVGAECTLDVSLCADENAACVSSGLRNNKCLCNDGFTANDDNICQNNDIPLQNLNLPHDAECNTNVADAGALLCNTDLVCEICIAEPSTCQIPLKALGSHCTGGLLRDGCDFGECGKDYPECGSGQCMCPEGEHASNYTACEADRALGADCDRTEQCTGITSNALCDTTCVCPNGLTKIHPHTDGKDYCYESLATEPCEGPEDCLSFVLSGDLGVCVDIDGTMSCGCDEKYILDPVTEECVTVPYNGDCELRQFTDKICSETLECRNDGGSKMCLCPAANDWHPELALCVHEEATADLEVGATCTVETTTAESFVCTAGLICAECVVGDGFTCMTDPDWFNLVSEAPSTVTEDSSTVTEDSSTVTEDSSTVTGEPPSETGEPPLETGEPPLETDEPPSETGEPPSETGEPPSETDDPPSGTDDPPSETEDPESTTPDDGSGDDAVLATLTTVVFFASFAMLKNLF